MRCRVPSSGLRIAILLSAALIVAAIVAASCENRAARYAVAATAASPGDDGAPPRWARRVYEVNCAACHGVESDGNGPAARMFVTRPRDFRSGIFKFRSTPSGSLPTDEDLFWHDRTARSE